VTASARGYEEAVMKIKKEQGALPSLADQCQAIARQIEDDETLSHLAEALLGEAYEDLLTQLVILANVVGDLAIGARLDKYATAAREDRRRVEIAQPHRDAVLEKIRLYRDQGDDFTGELLLAEHSLKQTIALQALGKYLDYRKLSRMGPASRDDMKAFNGWAVKLVAERLPGDLKKQFAQVSRLLRLTGITVSRQSVNRILSVAKQ